MAVIAVAIAVVVMIAAVAAKAIAVTTAEEVEAAIVSKGIIDGLVVDRAVQPTKGLLASVQP